MNIQVDNTGKTCDVCVMNCESNPASYLVTSEHLRVIQVYSDHAYLCDSHLDIFSGDLDNYLAETTDSIYVRQTQL